MLNKSSLILAVVAIVVVLVVTSPYPTFSSHSDFNFYDTTYFT